MEDITIVKVTDLRTISNEVKLLRNEIKVLREKESIKGYSVQATADLLGFSYNTVRKLIREEQLQAKYVNESDETGKCTIPAWSIENYLNTLKS